MKPDRAKRIENMIDAACPKGIFGATSDTMAARHRELVGAILDAAREEAHEIKPKETP